MDRTYPVRIRKTVIRRGRAVSPERPLHRQASMAVNAGRPVAETPHPCECTSQKCARAHESGKEV